MTLIIDHVLTRSLMHATALNLGLNLYLFMNINDLWGAYPIKSVMNHAAGLHLSLAMIQS